MPEPLTNQPTHTLPFIPAHTHSLKRTVFSRAFINFNTPADVAELKARFEGHLFVSARGTQYRCGGARRAHTTPASHPAHCLSSPAAGWHPARTVDGGSLGHARAPPQQQPPPQGTHSRRCAAVLCGAAQVHCRVCSLPKGPLCPQKEAAHGGHNRKRWVWPATAHHCPPSRLLCDPGSPLLVHWQGPPSNGSHTVRLKNLRSLLPTNHSPAAEPLPLLATRCTSQPLHPTKPGQTRSNLVKPGRTLVQQTLSTRPL